jgi:IS5 family transposase
MLGYALRFDSPPGSCEEGRHALAAGLKAPTEFGYKVMLQEAEELFITGYEVHRGNPQDASLLPAAVDRHKRVFGHAPERLAADRGFGTPTNDRLLSESGVKRISLPRSGKLSPTRQAYQRQRWFRNLQRWRAGGEGTISLLKRKYGLRRSRLRGHRGVRCWVAGAIWAHNLNRLATMG